MVVFFSVGRLLRLWQMHQGRRETVEPYLLPQKLLQNYVFIPCQGRSLTVIGVGILGINVIFMDNGVKCLRHVNDGKKRSFHIRQHTLPWIWYKGRDPKNQ